MLLGVGAVEDHETDASGPQPQEVLDASGCPVLRILSRGSRWQDHHGGMRPDQPQNLPIDVRHRIGELPAAHQADPGSRELILHQINQRP